MTKKKKKNSNVPRHKRMKRSARLQSEETWRLKYEGKDIVRGYSRHYGVDLICAMKELEMLGLKFECEYKERLHKDMENRIKQKEARKRKKKDEYIDFDSDDQFYYIAGYTSGGAPYGVTWEEMGCNEYNLVDNYEKEKNDFDESELFLDDEVEGIPF